MSLYIWFGLMIATIVAAPLTRRFRGKKPPIPQDFVMGALAMYGAIELFEVLIQVLTQQQLHALIGRDGIVMLCISSALGIYLSLQEFQKSF